MIKKPALFLFALLFSVQCRAAAGPKAAGDIGPGSVMVAMNDMNGTGSWLVTWLQDKKAVVRFDSSITTSSAWRVEGTGKEKYPVILLNENIKGRTDGYKYYAALIGREAGELVHIGMPDSAEKRYMINAGVAESYFELFGTRAELPVFSGVTDEALAEQVNNWVENDPDSGAAEIARRGGARLLKDLIGEAELALSQAVQAGGEVAPLERKLAALKSSKSYFENEFKGQEKYWWMLFQPQ
ncbi:MAG TPA: hypothetical protein PKI19_13160 [Elusimicrobiales bacterium]|nr:hypothetical protein [Elusimicrobiales bacterium]